MRVLFDIVHPADVHFFKFSILQLQASGSQVLVASREKDITTQLLSELNIPHHSISCKGRGIFGAVFELFMRNFRLWRLAREFAPDLCVANNSPCAAQVAWLLRKPSIVFDDTEINRANHFLYYPFASEVHTPDCYRLELGQKQRCYTGYHALAYVHPNHFQAQPEIFRSLHLEPGEKLVVVRLVRHDALHDVGMSGLSQAMSLTLARKMSAHSKVVVSSELAIPESLQPYALQIPFLHMHSLMQSADLVIGDSATMCAEAACLGTPAVLLDDKGRGYTDDLEQRYHLCHRYSLEDFDQALEKAEEILTRTDSSEMAERARGQLNKDTIDVSAYQLEQFQRLGTTRRTVN